MFIIHMPIIVESVVIWIDKEIGGISDDESHIHQVICSVREVGFLWLKLQRSCAGSFPVCGQH